MVNYLRHQIRVFLFTLTYFTRIPVPVKWVKADAVLMAEMHIYLPLVGLITGLLLTLVYHAFYQFFSHTSSIFFMLAAGIFLTGGFHEDGLADVCDGLGGSFDRKRKLEIMKDSRIGTYGTLGLVMLLLGKYTALSDITPENILPALVGAHVLSRWSAVPLMLFLPYIGQSQDKAALGRSASVVIAILTTLLTALGIALLVPDKFLIVAAFAIAVLFLAYLLFNKQLSGITGDCLGAANQITELAVYFAFVFHMPNSWNYF